MTEIYNLHGDIDWDELKKLIEITKEKEVQHTCKTCGEKFFCNTYYGNFPLCKKHRNSFKK